MDNLSIYERVRRVPDNAKKTIGAGRLKGMTDVSPMWRIKTLTEVFGAAGKGWWLESVKFSTYPAPEGTVSVQCELDLVVTIDGEKSAPIHGVGGSMLIAKERTGLYHDDEAYKKAFTDAQSVACKLLGVGADVYWSADSTKYTSGQSAPQGAPVPPPQAAQPKPFAPQEITCTSCGKPIKGYIASDGTEVTAERIVRITTKRFGKPLCCECQRKLPK